VIETLRWIADIVKAIYPDLKQDLYISNMDYTPDRFAKLAVLMTVVFGTIFLFPLGVIIQLMSPQALVPALLIISVFVYFIVFMIVVHLPRINKEALGRKIEAEVAVTGRRLLIQLESGKSLVNSIIDVARHKKESSKALEHLAYELYMGKPLERAIKESIDTTPSKTFRKIFIQIRNSLKTGSDLKHSLKAALEDITREKIVEFESFGKRLNPLGLFYMIFGTIAPSLGIVLFVIVLTIFQAKIDWNLLSLFLVMVLVLQFFFIMVFSRMRPELEI